MRYRGGSGEGIRRSRVRKGGRGGRNCGGISVRDRGGNVEGRYGGIGVRSWCGGIEGDLKGSGVRWEGSRVRC